MIDALRERTRAAWRAAMFEPHPALIEYLNRAADNGETRLHVCDASLLPYGVRCWLRFHGFDVKPEFHRIASCVPSSVTYEITWAD